MGYEEAVVVVGGVQKCYGVLHEPRGDLGTGLVGTNVEVVGTLRPRPVLRVAVRINVERWWSKQRRNTYKPSIS